MEKMINFITKHPHLIISIVAAILTVVFGIPFWGLLVFYLAYGIIMYLVHFASAVGMTGYLLDAFFHNQKAAIPLYRYAARHGSKNVYGLLAYGLYLLRSCQYAESLSVFEYILCLKDSKSVLIKYARQDFAIALWKNGRIQDAISTMEQMLADYEYFSIDFYTTLGYFYIEAGNYEKAIEYTNKALDEDESHGPAYDNLGQIAYRQGRYEEAKNLLLKALDLKDTMADSKYYLGLIYEQAGDRDTARDFFIAAHESDITGMNTVERETIDAKYQEYI